MLYLLSLSGAGQDMAINQTNGDRAARRVIEYSSTPNNLWPIWPVLAATRGSPFGPSSPQKHVHHRPLWPPPSPAASPQPSRSEHRRPDWRGHGDVPLRSFPVGQGSCNAYTTLLLEPLSLQVEELEITSLQAHELGVRADLRDGLDPSAPLSTAYRPLTPSSTTAI